MSSAVPDRRGRGADVVAPEARVELDRIRRRWSELPVDRAEARMPVLRRLLADLAPRSSHSLRITHRGPPLTGPPRWLIRTVVPDLGPAVVVDQLTVLVWDAYAAGRGDGIPQLLTERPTRAGLTARRPAPRSALRATGHGRPTGLRFQHGRQRCSTRGTRS